MTRALEGAVPLSCPHCGRVMGANNRGSLKQHVNHCLTHETRFWGRVDKSAGPDACWPFQGCRDKWGYAHVGRNSRRHQAHRMAYQLAKGAIPAGKLVLHSCDNPPCCNPAHLRLGTDADNMLDKLRKGRQRRGERSPQAKLSNAQAIEIRAKYQRRLTGKRTTWSNAVELSKEYGVSPQTISQIALGHRWSPS